MECLGSETTHDRSGLVGSLKFFENFFLIQMIYRQWNMLSDMLNLDYIRGRDSSRVDRQSTAYFGAPGSFLTHEVGAK